MCCAVLYCACALSAVVTIALPMVNLELNSLLSRNMDFATGGSTLGTWHLALATYNLQLRQSATSDMQWTLRHPVHWRQLDFKQPVIAAIHNVPAAVIDPLFVVDGCPVFPGRIAVLLVCVQIILGLTCSTATYIRTASLGCFNNCLTGSFAESI